jgi:hypothetical protein
MTRRATTVTSTGATIEVVPEPLKARRGGRINFAIAAVLDTTVMGVEVIALGESFRRRLEIHVRHLSRRRLRPPEDVQAIEALMDEAGPDAAWYVIISGASSRSLYEDLREAGRDVTARQLTPALRERGLARLLSAHRAGKLVFDVDEPVAEREVRRELAAARTTLTPGGAPRLEALEDATLSETVDPLITAVLGSGNDAPNYRDAEGELWSSYDAWMARRGGSR